MIHRKLTLSIYSESVVIETEHTLDATLQREELTKLTLDRQINKGIALEFNRIFFEAKARKTWLGLFLQQEQPALNSFGIRTQVTKRPNLEYTKFTEPIAITIHRPDDKKSGNTFRKAPKEGRIDGKKGIDRLQIEDSELHHFQGGLKIIETCKS